MDRPAPRRSDDGRTGHFVALELGAELGQGRGIESRADLAAIPQAAALVVCGDDERAEAGARPGGIGEAHDRELLPRLALRLEPRAGAPRAMGSVSALGHHALEPLPARFAEERSAIALNVIAEPQDAAVLRARDDRAEEALALDERALAQVPSVELHEVERIEREPLGLAGERVLEALKVALSSRVEGHGLPVQNDRVDRQITGRLGDCGEARGPVLPRAGE